MAFFFTVASVLRCGVVVNKDFLVVVVNDAAHVRHAAVPYFHVVLVKDEVDIVVWWEVLIRLRKVLATFVCTFLLYGGLDQMMFLLLFLFVGAVVFFLQ